MNKTLMLINVFVLMVTLPHGQIKTSPSVDHKGAHLHQIFTLRIRRF